MAFGFHREQWNELPPLTIHPCRNPLLPPAIYIYIYIYIYMYVYHERCIPNVREPVCVAPALPNVPPGIPVYFTHESPTSCPTNQDLSLLLVVTDATGARTAARPTPKWCVDIVPQDNAVLACAYEQSDDGLEPAYLLRISPRVRARSAEKESRSRVRILEHLKRSSNRSHDEIRWTRSARIIQTGSLDKDL